MISIKYYIKHKLNTNEMQTNIDVSINYDYFNIYLTNVKI